MSEMTPRILIVEDHELLAESLALGLEQEGFEALIVTGPTFEAILERARTFRPDLVLLDLNLGEELGSGVPVIEGFLGLGSLVVALTGVTDDLRLAECVEAGVHGLLSKRMSFDDLVDSVKEALAGDELLSPAERDRLLGVLRTSRNDENRKRALFSELTTREREVLRDLTEGRSAQEIAASSYVSIATVRSQIRAILVKVGVNSQLRAVALARRLGWFD